MLIPLANSGFSQTSNNQSQKRALIDSKRIDGDYLEADALDKAKEFIQIDSTYYVPYLYIGMYKQEIAADFNGFKAAIPYLKKAIALLEKDFTPQLLVRTSDPNLFFKNYKIQLDYSFVTDALYTCYSNTSQPDSAFLLMIANKKWNFQFEYFAASYQNMAWLVHRNRIFNKGKYFFLKDSLMGNEYLANKYLDSATSKVTNDMPLNVKISAAFANDQMYGIYQYKAMLFMYQLKGDSAQYYYDLLQSSKYFPHNNYGNFLTVLGDFEGAQNEYKQAKIADANSKYLKEYEYFGSIIKLSEGLSDNAVSDLKTLIKSVGSVPGWGWYNIALSRAYQYNGNVEASAQYLKKASDFREVHYGTSLGEKQYRFSINLIEANNIDKSAAAIEFEDKHWWFKPTKLWSKFCLFCENLWNDFKLTSDFSANPERDIVQYRLFSTESTSSWDELDHLLESYGKQFLSQKFHNWKQTDARTVIRKYFNLYDAKLEMSKGNYDLAYQYLTTSLANKEINIQFELLYLARLNEALSIASIKTHKSIAEIYKYEEDFYSSYPQLVPFSKVEMPFKLKIKGKPNEDLLDELKSSSIKWVNASDPVPTVTLSFTSDNQVTVNVTNNNGKVVVADKSVIFKDNKGLHADLVLYQMFNIVLN